MRELDTKGIPGTGEFEPCLGEVGNLNQKCHIIPVEYMWLFKVVLVWRKSKAKK